MLAILIHPLTIAIVGGIFAIGVALYSSYSAKNMMFSKMRIEAETTLSDTVNNKVDTATCDAQIEKCEKRFDKGDIRFGKIERALVAIYVQVGGNARDLGL